MADDKVKEVFQVVADLLLLASDVSKGLSFSEINELLKAVGDIKQVINDASLILPQFASLSAADQADLVAFLQANIQFPANAAVQSVAEKALEVLVSLSGLAKLLGA